MGPLQKAHIQFFKCPLCGKRNTTAGIACTAACFASVNSIASFAAKPAASYALSVLSSTVTTADVAYTTVSFASTNAYYSTASFTAAA